VLLKEGVLSSGMACSWALPYTKMAKSQTKVHDEDETYSKLLDKIKLFYDTISRMSSTVVHWV
jgi:hypothetical protein